MSGAALPLEIFYLSGALIMLSGVLMALAGKSAAARPGVR